MADAGVHGLRFSTFLGEESSDFALATVVGPDGAIYVGGGTASRNFPLRDALQPQMPDDPWWRGAAFVAGLYADGSTLRFSTCLLGTRTGGIVNDLAVDRSGDLLVAMGVYQAGAVFRITDSGRTLVYFFLLGTPKGVAFDAERHRFVAHTPYPHRVGFILPPGQQAPCNLGLSQIIELDARGQVVTVMIAPMSFGTFVVAPGGQMILAGGERSWDLWPPRPENKTDEDVQVVVMRTGHGRMAWRTSSFVRTDGRRVSARARTESIAPGFVCSASRSRNRRAASA